MKKTLLLAVLLLLLHGIYAQSYTVGVQSVTWTDSSRSNRSVPVEFHYPGTNTAIAAGSFGFVVFGHGFDIPISAYYNYADSLAKHGYIVALTSNEGGLSPSHPNLAQDLIYIYNNMISQSIVNASSPLYHHVKPRGAIAGHSMGGGCAVLSCQYSDTATCYWTLSEATTTPSSITAAANMYKPYLSFAGSDDCIAPPSTNQIPTYDSAHSICKTFVEITNATHCQFALNNSTCVLGEDLTGCGTTSLSMNAQNDTALAYIYLYLDYYLNGNCNAWTQFQSLYNADHTDVLMQSCNNVIPTNPAITGASSFCSGNSDTLYANPAGFLYNWSNNATTAAINFSNTGTYSLSVSNGTCTVTSSPKIITENLPPATPSSITAPDTVCSGIANINISVVNDTTATTYNWTLPAGFSISTGNNTHAISVISGNSSGAISVTAQNSCGVSQSVQKNIIVNPSGLAAPGSIWGDSFPCVGQPVQYVIPAVNGATSYMWGYPSGWVLISDSSADTISLTCGIGTGSITVQAVNVCGQGAPASLSVVPVSAPVISAIAGDSLVCIGQTVQFVAAPETGAASYLWNYPTGWNLVSGNNTDTLNLIAGSSPGDITVQASNVCGHSTTIALNINVHSAPSVGIIAGPDTVCVNAAGALWFNLSNVLGADSIYWGLPNSWVLISGQGTDSILANVNQQGGIINAIAYNGCGNANATPLNLTIIDTAQSGIISRHDTLITGTGISYKWYLNGALLTGANSQYYIASESGNYSVAVTNAAGCTDTSAPFNFIYLSIDDVTGPNSIVIFPNPSPNGIFTVVIDNNFAGGELSLLDVLGRKVFNQQITGTQMLINLSNLSHGVYTACIETKDGLVSIRQLIR